MTYDRVNWQNEPSENTPLSAENLNKMDSAIKTLSEMVVANPVEADTDELKKIGIEGTIYKIAGGHELVNSSGSTMTQRSKMAFLDTHLTDDSGNNTTKVEVVKEVTTAQFANETERGLYRITDKPDSVINAEQVAYGSGNVKTALDKTVWNVLMNGLSTAFPVTTTETGITIPNISDYTELLFFGKANNEVRGNLLMIKDLFANGYYCYILCTGGTVGYITIKYVSDTEIKVASSLSAYNYLTIYAR